MLVLDIPGLRCCQRGDRSDAGLSSATTGTRPAVRERLVCPDARTPPFALVLPFSSARAHRLWVLSFHGPDSKLQLDILKINIRLICELLRRGA